MQTPEKRRIVVQIGGRDVDFTDVPPFTGADKKALFKMGIDFSKINDLNPEQEGQLVLFCVKKKDEGATGAEADALPVTIQNSIVMHFVQSSREVKNPFDLPSSTSLPASTAGEKKS